jgi:hypothetical protein
MRKTILTTMLPYLICSATFAQEKGTVQNKNIDIPVFEKLVINASVKVLLRESEQPFLELNGSPSFIKSVKIKNYKDEISVNSNYFSFKETENTVTIGVKKLKYLFVRQDADIVSGNTLLSPILNILLDAAVTLHLSNSGKTNITTSEGYFLEDMR